MPSVRYKPLNPLGEPQKRSVSFADAVFNPTPAGGGLFMPEKIVPIKYFFVRSDFPAGGE